jgi:hypothetical protein
LIPGLARRPVGRPDSNHDSIAKPSYPSPRKAAHAYVPPPLHALSFLCTLYAPGSLCCTRSSRLNTMPFHASLPSCAKPTLLELVHVTGRVSFGRNSREWRYQKDMRLWFTRQASHALLEPTCPHLTPAPAPAGVRPHDASAAAASARLIRPSCGKGLTRRDWTGWGSRGDFPVLLRSGELGEAAGRLPADVRVHLW